MGYSGYMFESRSTHECAVLCVVMTWGEEGGYLCSVINSESAETTALHPCCSFSCRRVHDAPLF